MNKNNRNDVFNESLLDFDIKDVKYLNFGDLYSKFNEQVKIQNEDSNNLNQPLFKNDIRNKSPWAVDQKFKKMSFTDMVNYAKKSEKNKQEVKKLMEDQYNFLIQNAPTKWYTRYEKDSYQKMIDQGIDPFDPIEIQKFEKGRHERGEGPLNISFPILLLKFLAFTLLLLSFLSEI